MVFHSFVFFWFFIIVYAVSYALNYLARKNESAAPFKIYKLILLGASYYFYGYWDYRFLSLILFSTTADYWLGLKISQANDAGQRKSLVVVSVVVNIGFLGFFKYCNFFIESANLVLARADLSMPHLDIILPVGISFYTFQSLSYTLDVYRKDLEATRDFVDFALYVAFFPQLVAGPIVRARDFLPQLLRPTIFSGENLFKGFQVFLYGLFLKVVVADNIAVIIDPIFKVPSAYDSLAVWVAVLGYATQIFCDFAGYSEMAIGLALSMGYWLPVNFRSPYLAVDLFDFWRRWHISFSTWLKDYLYIPLGGNRSGLARTCINVFITMALGGLWHGAEWKFILWGCYHGLGLAINRILTITLGERLPSNLAMTVCKWAMTLLFVCFGWVLFRSGNLDIAAQIYRKLFLAEGSALETLDWKCLNARNLFFIPCMIVVHLWLKLSKQDTIFFRDASFASHCYVILIIFLVFLFAPIDHAGFIYFQF